MKEKINGLAGHLNEIFDGDPWYGDNLLKKLSAITASQADWRPHPEAHSIAQVLQHIINWKQLVIRKLESNSPQDIQMDSTEDWDPALTVASEEEWQHLLQQFTAAHQRLLEVLNTKTDEELHRQVSNRSYDMAFLVNGIYEHNIYHLGQIGYIHSLWQKSH